MVKVIHKNNNRRKVYALASCLIVVLTGLGTSAFAGATSDSPWLSTANPTLINDGEVGQFPNATNGNQDCTPGDFTAQTYNYLGQLQQFTDQQCAVQTLYGRVGGDRVELNGTKLSGKTSSLIVPIQNSATALQMSIGFNNYLAFYNNLTTSITGTTSYNGGLVYSLAPSDSMLADRDGNNLSARGLSISSNNKWFVTDTMGKGIIRVNLETKEVLPFAASPNYNLGFDPALNSAISSDGRFALVYIGSSGMMKMYDLSTCGSVPSTITGPVSCESKDITNLVSQQVQGFEFFNYPKFVNDNIFSFYVAYRDTNNVRHYSKYRMVAAGQTPTTLEYLGLGDSYSSGEGAYHYYEGTDTSQNKCHLSQVAYPYLIGQQLNLNSYKSVACSQAKSVNVVAQEQHPIVPSPHALGDIFPGAQTQLSFVDVNKPNVLTMTMGGNDIGFSDIIKRCIALGDITVETCYSSYEERLELVRLVNSKFSVLTDMYTKLKSTSPSATKIYVAGYPRIAKDNGTCGVNVRLDGNEVKFSNLLVDYLNSVIEAAANRTGVRYVDVSDALYGHRLCEANYSDASVNGLTVGNDEGIAFIKIIGHESYHPNEMGHRLLKNQIVSKTSNLTQSMPTPNPSAAAPTESSTLPMLNAPTSSKPVRNLVFKDELTSDLAVRGNTQTVHVNNTDAALKKNTSYSFELHTTPISLGAYSTDQSGNLSATVTIPSNVPVGFHTLHIYGQNIAGENIDIYKATFVAASASDLDGDGTSNELDSCDSTPTVSVLDTDQDGIDDVCDSYISDSPTDINALYRARNGLTANNESVDDVYIERNIAKSATLLGITDVDSDSDGWVTVGKSGSTTSGAIANFWVEDMGPTENRIDKYIPHVSFRSDDLGCVQYKPTSLATVTDSTQRTVLTEATNTATCRNADPSADTDNNSIADNQQPLYRGRNGIAANNEDADSIYIERNIIAGEAVLGISDYDADNDGWAIIGKTSSTTNGTFARIALTDATGNTVLSTNGSFNTTMLEMTRQQRRAVIPTVAVAQPVVGCAGIKPLSLDYVSSTQTRAVSTASLPPELGCT